MYVFTSFSYEWHFTMPVFVYCSGFTVLGLLLAVLYAIECKLLLFYGSVVEQPADNYWRLCQKPFFYL
ncbi:hypothetical protein C7N43_11520 [Sphingobacteriales bacterium UPWRP_1]|nr:hypothetical protein C7N43_11520 [Sphingobacteriales bacterium UPWRP_1]